MVILKKHLVHPQPERIPSQETKSSLSREHDCASLAATGPTAAHMGSEELSFNMKQKLWTLAFALALMKTRLDFFHGRMEGDGTLGTQEGQPSIST